MIAIPNNKKSVLKEVNFNIKESKSLKNLTIDSFYISHNGTHVQYPSFLIRTDKLYTNQPIILKEGSIWYIHPVLTKYHSYEDLEKNIKKLILIYKDKIKEKKSLRKKCYKEKKRERNPGKGKYNINLNYTFIFFFLS
jgi:hypothetical protein